MRYNSLFKLLFILSGCCCVAVLLVLSPLVPTPIDFNSCAKKCPTINNQNSQETTVQQQFESDHKLAVIVPFRNRFEQLLQFVPHLNSFLNRQSIPHKIFIINQDDGLRFNRASLINIGYLLSRLDYDYIAMHDVDLLPLNDNLKYSFPGDGTPFHLSSPDLHPKYHYKTFVGGILLITSNDYESVDGMSIKYWGWGLEDDEFYARLKQANFNITRPVGITTGINDTFLHIHDRNSRRDTVKLFNQREVTRRRDRDTGVHNVNYKLISTAELVIKGAPCVVHSVELICDYQVTPWCDHRYAAAVKANSENKTKPVLKKKSGRL